MTPSTKLSFIFDLGPNAQNLLPKICTKSPISRLVWQIDRRYLGLPGGFQGWPIQWNHAKCCGADPCCCGNEIWARRGDPVVYQLVCLSVCLPVCHTPLVPSVLCRRTCPLTPLLASMGHDAVTPMPSPPTPALN